MKFVAEGLAKGDGRSAQRDTPADAADAHDSISFGVFRLLPARRLLVRGDQPVRVGSRSFDILVALVNRAGSVVSTEELIAQVWPKSVVADNNLRVHIAGLRRALADGADGQRFIENIPLKGYAFVAPVERMSTGALSGLPLALTGAGTTPLLGREEAICSLGRLIQSRRLVTIVGPAGIGKTVLGRAVSWLVAANFHDGCFFVDLGLIDNPALVTGAIASGMGIALRTDDPLLGLAKALRTRRALLLLLDNCEHVIEAAASVAETLLRHAPSLSILGTSREPLLAEGEFVQRLAPLAIPSSSESYTVEEALRFSAVQLFIERATATMDDFQVDASNVTSIVEICRRLDGIPLAIELAASRVHAFGVGDLAHRLNERLSLTMRGRRTALPRHQTLGAAIDWSYVALSSDEQLAMRNLAVFRGSFTMEAADALSCAPEGRPWNAMDAVSALVSKSLLQMELRHGEATYRQLEITRDYAVQKLQEAGELNLLRKRHAEYLARRFECLAEDWASEQTTDAEQFQDGEVADIRAALDWAFSPEGEPRTGVRLLTSSAALWFGLSLMDEFRARAKLALQVMVERPIELPAVEMRLQIAYGHALWHSMSDLGVMRVAFERARVLGESLPDIGAQLQAIWGLWLVQTLRGEYESAVSLIDEFGALAERSSEATTSSTLTRMQSLGLHLHGHHVQARKHAEQLLSHAESSNLAATHSGFQFDKTVAGHATMARILWLQGCPDQALVHAESAVQSALAIGHDLSLCYALAHGSIPVAMWAGEYGVARRYASMLIERSNEGSFEFWRTFGRAYSLALDLDPEAPAAVGEWYAQWLYRDATGVPLLETLATVSPNVAAEALLDRACAGAEGWCAPELMRIKAQRCAESGTVDAVATAESLLLRSIDLARQQGALSWELRSSISLTQLRIAAYGDGVPATLLADVYARFAEGFATRDLREAASLLGEAPDRGRRSPVVRASLFLKSGADTTRA
jgi:predicted ATPase/DNA-binding winged helix-turn-helix (wHTH) protein